ncbi:hypothetical protein CYLTODRAFT_417081 [Cylindrobasidium torrendii FP15055 ss-10]|uniref:Phytanoyl-CoA dioxygenase n=1 Tax=Cylindrobasidium torrendii FP15055 ss-10 TaxID=1314674 RepID=A0A0D7BUV3_9AGAR|nr:hypothetical protein CYLTODRAFT_417081 [Cylindrobasidium torrendii FP15055 ss-10]
MVSPYRQQLDEQGFVIIPDLIAPDGEFERLRAACDDAVAQTRAGTWKLRRTVGKQFPPYGDANPDSWGVQMLMHPDLGPAAKVFAEWYTGDRLTGAVRDLLGCGEENLEMELFNLLINPLGHDFALSWHRDDVKHNASAEEEEEALKLWHFGMQWNTALYEDSSLYVVPGSHKIVRTDEQRALSCTPDPASNPLDMPGAIPVTLKPGETVFYNSNIIHVGTYKHTVKRATLHGTMGDTRGGSVRARNILQHGLDWMYDKRFQDGLTERGKGMLDRLIQMKEGAGADVGYSLDA